MGTITVFLNHLGSDKGLAEANVKNEVVKKCPDDKWKEIDGKCYLVSEGQTDWEAARQNCLGIGGKLAEPLSAEENGAIAVLVKEQHGGGGYWIGLSDREEESK